MFYVILREWYDVEYHHECHEFVAVRSSLDLATALKDELQKAEKYSDYYHYSIEEHTDVTIKGS